MRHIFPAIAVMLAIVISLLIGRDASADLIDVQFSGHFSFSCPGGGNSCTNPAQTGAAFVGSAGDQWNDFASGSGSGSLLDAAGSASGASIVFSSDATYSSYTDGTNKNNFATTSYANLFGGYLATTNSSGNGMVITLSGLYAGEAYNLYVYSEQDGTGSSGRSSSITANGVTKIDTQTGVGAFVQGATYVQLAGTANAAGNVVINVANLNGEADINGLQLVTLPEPASVTLMAFGLGALVLVGRRRKLA